MASWSVVVLAVLLAVLLAVWTIQRWADGADARVIHRFGAHVNRAS